jgi:hypothetical protein
LVRLVVSLAIAAISGVGLWSAVVVLPTIQAEFGVDRGGASLPYTVTWSGSPSAASAWGGWPIGLASAYR